MTNTSYKREPKPWVHKFKKDRARILSSGKVVEDLGLWNVVKDRSPSKLIKVKTVP